MSCILRIISSQDPVRLEEYEELVESVSLLIAVELKWVKINFTLHGVIHHSVQLIALNESNGLGILSEEGLEANNKYIRRYSELLSRKSSQIEQMTDVMGRLLERSDPLISTEKMKYRNNISCSICNSKKHSSRNHEKKIQLSTYDRIVNEVLIDSL